MNIFERIRDTAVELELKWGMRAYVVIACAGFKDEHVQFYHPKHLEMPAFVMNTETGEIEEHPCSPLC